MSDKSPFHSYGTTLRADPPQRYLGNHARYLAQGGRLRIEDDLEGYLAAGRNSGDMARFYFFSLVFDQIVKEGVTGDLAELGVYRGNTATLLASYARRLGATAYLLDTYEGFSAEDLKGIDADKRMDFADTSLERVRALVGDDNVKYVKGFFPATASQLPEDGTYCLVHIDCDLYAPIRSALEYFYPRLAPGGFMIVHDYSSLHWNGAEKAVDEFFLRKPECPIPLPDGIGSAVIRKARQPDAAETWLDRKRRTLLRPDWTEAGSGKLADLQGEGWSGPEVWGVWGVGPRHVLHLPCPSDPGNGLDLELDVSASVTPLRAEQIVDILVGGKSLDSWTFAIGANRGVRALHIPAALAAPPPTDEASITVEFCPRSVKYMSEVAPQSSDTRQLGLALHRIRLLSA